MQNMATLAMLVRFTRVRKVALALEEEVLRCLLRLAAPVVERWAAAVAPPTAADNSQSSMRFKLQLPRDLATKFNTEFPE